jgi:hypothetical protein
VQYDFGKFAQTGSLNSPPQILLSAVAEVRADEMRGRSQLSTYASKLKRITKFQRATVMQGLTTSSKRRTTTQAGRRATGAAPTDKRLGSHARARWK